MGLPSWIRASELQAYAYCARSWWLQYVLGLEPEDRERLIDGSEQHRYDGEGVVRAGRFQQAGRWLLLIAALLVGLALLLLLRGG
jgi:hypothetical protein